MLGQLRVIQMTCWNSSPLVWLDLLLRLHENDWSMIVAKNTCGLETLGAMLECVIEFDLSESQIVNFLP